MKMSLLPINFRSLNQNFYNLRVHSEYLTHSSAGDNLFINCLDKLTWKKKMHTFTIRRIYGGNEEEFGSWNAHSLHASLANIKSSIAKLGKEMSDEQWKPVFITAIDRNINCTQLRTRENCCIASRDNWYCFLFLGHHHVMQQVPSFEKNYNYLSLHSHQSKILKSLHDTKI